MSNIVVLAGFYYPYFSANGSIMKNIVDELKKNHNVKVIAVKNDFNLSDSYEFEGHEIMRVNDFSTCFHYYCVKKMKNTNNLLVRKYYNILLQTKRLLLLTKKLLRATSIDKHLVSEQLRALKKINETFPIDVIVPVSLPFESILSALEYKKMNADVKVLPYQLDHFSESSTLHNFDFIKRSRFDKHIEIEKKCLDNSYHYFILPQIEEHYNKDEFEAFKEKITICEHPLLKDKKQIYESNEISFSDKKINLVFAGMLNKHKRNPSYMLDMLKLIPNEENICFNVFHLGDCGEILDSYKGDLGESLMNYGHVPLGTAFEAMSKADILINMGVTDGNQVSGKIFDYFAFGKPIVHMYFFDEDPNLVYFKDYPLSICLKIDLSRIEENANRLFEFCKKYLGEKKSFAEVEKLFYYATPEYVASEFLKRIG